jgi:arylsulfatase
MRRTLILLVCTAFFLVTTSARADTLAGKRPNIIFILTDDQGYGDLSATGNPVLKTPNIDAYYAGGVRFSDFNVSPTCAPTRSALLTGRHEFRNGVTHTINERERLTLDAVTLPQVLKTAGYTTGIFGKWHLGDEPDHWPSARGFDEMFIHGAGGIGQSYPCSCGDAPGNTYFNPAILHNGKFEKTQGYCTDVFFGQATSWIDRQRQEKKPFLAWIATNAPHAPLTVKPEDEALYAGKVGPQQAKFFGMIHNIDQNVGKLHAKLAEWGMDRDTLVILMNDNGGTAGVQIYNAGMRGQKVQPYRGGTRAFSIWHWPAALKPGDVKALASNQDFFPTIAELAGAKLDEKAQKQIDGRSLVPLLADPNAPWADRMLVTHTGRWAQGKAADSKYAHCSIRNTRWHLVCDDKKGEKKWELYDVQADPGEKKDVVAEHPDVVREFEAFYDKWWAETLPMMTNENAPWAKANPFKELYWMQFGGGPEKK